MATLIRALLGVALVAHGLVHLLYLSSEANDPDYPFTLQESLLVPEPARRTVAFLLLGGTVVTFALLGLAVWDVPGIANIWPALALAAAGASLALLIAFWDTRLLAGVVIDVALVALAVIRPEWTDRVVD